MHGISSASPSHVKVGNLCYDVTVWTFDEYGAPEPWIVRDGELVSLTSLPFHLGVTMGTGTAAEAEARGTKA